MFNSVPRLMNRLTLRKCSYFPILERTNSICPCKSFFTTISSHRNSANEFYSTRYFTNGGNIRRLSQSVKNLKQSKILSVNSKDDETEEPHSSDTIIDNVRKDEGKQKKDGFFTGDNVWRLGVLFLAGGTFLMLGTIIPTWGAPKKDEDGSEIKDEYSDQPLILQYVRRSFREVLNFKKSIEEPVSNKLLPEPLPEPYIQPRYTLVIELNGVLVKPDWTLDTGWRFKKRPMVDYFLQKCSHPYFEIVIYTRESGMIAWPLLDKLDPDNHIMYRLFRENTRYVNGVHIKDLDCLNRDLKRVIFLDPNSDETSLHPSNSLKIKAWDGTNDKDLIDLASFLHVIYTSGVDDVRDVIRHYNRFDDPLNAFREKQRLLHEQQIEQEKLRLESPKQKSLFNFSRSNLVKK